jgi:hypothetical protein
VSIPLDSETEPIESIVRNLFQKLLECGEEPRSFRCGYHIHVGMPTNLRILKNILRLGAYLEDIFFYIGGQGYAFRGDKINSSAYCRAITEWGPPAVRHDGRHAVQIFKLEDLLVAKTTREFWYRFGELSNKSSNSERYVPHRYMWLNVYSLLLHGTLEFRVFNKTLSAKQFLAEIELCQKFCDMCLRNSYKDLPVHSIYHMRSKEEMIQTLEMFATESDLTVDSLEVLINIIKGTEEIHLPEKYMWSHISRGDDRTYWNGSSEYSPEHIEYDDVASIEVVDIHRLRGESPSGSRRNNEPNEEEDRSFYEPDDNEEDREPE